MNVPVLSYSFFIEMLQVSMQNRGIKYIKIFLLIYRHASKFIV